MLLTQSQRCALKKTKQRIFRSREAADHRFAAGATPSRVELVAIDAR